MTLIPPPPHPCMFIKATLRCLYTTVTGYRGSSHITVCIGGEYIKSRWALDLFQPLTEGPKQGFRLIWGWSFVIGIIELTAMSNRYLFRNSKKIKP